MSRITITGANWRDSSLTPMFFFIDSTAAFPLILFLMHIRIWTFVTSCLFILFFTIIAKFNFTIPIFKRWLRNLIAGPYKIARPWWRS